MTDKLKSTLAIGVLAAVLLAIPLAAPALRAPLQTALAIAFCALGLLILLRAGQVSFGHALYYACGAYTVAFAARHTSEMIWLLALAVLSSLVLGALLGAVLCRYRDIFYAMLNLAFSMVGFTMLLKLYGVTGGSDGMSVQVSSILGMEASGATFGAGLYAVSIVLIGLALLLIHKYLQSPPGQALAALKTNETRLEYLGVSGRQVLYTAHVASAALAGLGGALAAMSTGHVTPDMAYWSRSAEFVFVAILGGISHVSGALIGSVAFEWIRGFANAYATHAWQLIMGAVLIGIVLYAPFGLIGLGRRLARNPKPETGA